MSNSRIPALWLSAASLFAFSGACADDSSDQTDQEAQVRELLAIPDHFEVPAIPDYNPPTAAKLQLGRMLFYDKRLSGNQTQSCGSCHLQALAFADGKKTPTGSTGHVLARNSPGLANVAYFSYLTWSSNGLVRLEDQLQVPIRGENPVELGVGDGLVPEVLARFDGDPQMAQLFRAAFPNSESGATIEKIIFALATFCRALNSGDSPYDRYIKGDSAALTEQQKRGLALFESERLECFHCHRGTQLTTAYHDPQTPDDALGFPFFNTGLYNISGDGSYPSGNQGLYESTLRLEDRGRFRPPSLRNVALTAPYFHDGSAQTLTEVIKTYAAAGRKTDEGPFAGDGRLSPYKSGLIGGFFIEDNEIEDLVAFLSSLTDTTFINDPRLSDPFAP